MRTTRAATKRTAMEDKVQGISQAGGRRKRPALANLSNLETIPCQDEIFSDVRSESQASLREDSQTLTGSCTPPELEKRGWSFSHGYINIDSHEQDPQMCAEYAYDIYENLRIAETRRRPGTDFLERVQGDINSVMRGILVDWLVEVAEEYKLVPDTLYLTCSYIDLYLSNNHVRRSQLQLLGVSCMLLAAKYEEIYAPQVEEFCYITDNTYRRDEVLKMERDVLKDLSFELGRPTTKSFLRRYIRAAQTNLPAPSHKLEFLGNYLAELTLLEYDFVKYLPSHIAAAAVFLAKWILEPNFAPWTSTLEHYTGYKPSKLKDCVVALHALQLNTKGCTLPATREKYRQSKFQKVSLIMSPTEIPPLFFGDLGILSVHR